MSSESMGVIESMYGEIRHICGPFQPDPNISVVLLHLGDRLWIINRPLFDEPNEDKLYGILEFHDIRIFRTRAYNTDSYIDNTKDNIAETNRRCIEVDDSSYLRESIHNDEQRSPEALSSHHHYIVYDGRDRIIEIIAKNVVTSSTSCSSFVNLEKLFNSDESPFEKIK